MQVSCIVFAPDGLLLASASADKTICLLEASTGGLNLATSALDLGLPLPHMRRNRARACHICTGTGAHPRHICTGTWAHPTTSALGLGLPSSRICTGTGLNLPQLHRDWAHPCHITTWTASTGTALGGALLVGDVLVQLTGLHRCKHAACCVPRAV